MCGFIISYSSKILVSITCYYQITSRACLYQSINVWYSRYLQEIGFTDTIIDVRAARVRQLLGLPTDGSATSPVANGLPLAKEKRPNDGSDHRFVFVMYFKLFKFYNTV